MNNQYFLMDTQLAADGIIHCLKKNLYPGNDGSEIATASTSWGLGLCITRDFNYTGFSVTIAENIKICVDHYNHPEFNNDCAIPQLIINYINGQFEIRFERHTEDLSMNETIILSEIAAKEFIAIAMGLGHRFYDVMGDMIDEY